MTLRILVVAHSHPAFTKGGAEITAYQLYQAFRERPDCDAWFLARHAEPGFERPGSAFAARNGDGRDLLYRQDSDHFDFSAMQLHYLAHDFPALLSEIKPDVVHLHHYVNLGIETIRVIRNVLPDCRIILTLHEFLAICNRQGQMLKTDGRLCESAGPQDCHLCLPERSPPDYFLRERYLKSFFSLVDRFISPSEFLKQRYAAWGLPAERITVLENGQPPIPAAPWRQPDGDLRTVFGYFGQITPYKGVDVLLEAFSLLPEEVRQHCRLEVHGGGHESFAPDFRQKIDQALSRTPDKIFYAGPYASEDLPRRMAGVDWVIVPSIWWENSPLVIQEAFRHRRPVICSNIGGMAEKVTEGKDGLHFRAGDPAALAAELETAVNRTGLLDQLRQGIESPPTIDETADACLKMYGG